VAFYVGARLIPTNATRTSSRVVRAAHLVAWGLGAIIATLSAIYV
jgi:hypothetical protein